jgi:dTDP-4-dehydrorhamnose 3,5-epimerase
MEMPMTADEIDFSALPDEESEIQGVVVCPLARHVNARGHLMEVQRQDDPHWPGFGQAYTTCTHPDVIKAWYRHQEQLDQIAPVSGIVKLVLFDARPESTTYQRLMSVVLSEAQPLLVQIPPGIWHGFQALGEQPAYLLHLNAKAFIHGHVDEERLDCDTDLIPYRWSSCL